MRGVVGGAGEGGVKVAVEDSRPVAARVARAVLHTLHPPVRQPHLTIQHVYTGLFISCTFHSFEMIYFARSGILSVFSPQPIVERSKLIVRPAVQSALSVLRCQQKFAMNCPEPPAEQDTQKY